MAAKQEPLVAVYSPDGEREVHTRPNARDLVMGAGWSWHPKAAPTPAGFAPFRTTKTDGPEPAQRVLDRTGGSGTVKTGPDADAEEEEVIHVSVEGDAQVIDAAAAPAAPTVIDAAAPAAEPEVIDAAAPSGRGRRRATQATDEG